MVLTDDAWPQPGGIATWTRRVVAHLRARGDAVALYARSRPGLPAGTTGVWAPHFARRGHLALALASGGARRRADRVVATTWTVAPPRHRGLVVVHGSDVTAAAHDPSRRQRVLARAQVRAVSGYLAAAARSLGAGEVPVLAAPVPLAERPRAEGATRWAWAGRMVPGKGGERFLAWLQAAGRSGVMVGDGPLREAWQRDAARRGLQVDFPGWLDEPAWLAHLEASAVCVLPGAVRRDGGAEGLNLVAVEAAARGVPVVVTDVGGQREAAGPGLVLPPGTAPTEAAELIGSWRSGGDRGEEAWAWARAHHGVARTVAGLEAPR